MKTDNSDTYDMKDIIENSIDNLTYNKSNIRSRNENRQLK